MVMQSSPTLLDWRTIFLLTVPVRAVALVIAPRTSHIGSSGRFELRAYCGRSG